MSPPPAVLAAYPPGFADLRWLPLGNGGGFSGAGVWRGEAPVGTPLFALKAWPPGYPADRLRTIHTWMTTARHSAGLRYVPAVVSARTGVTVVQDGGRVWDLSSWMPGRADFTADPSDARLAAAVGAVASLHRAWAPAEPAVGPSEGVRRRVEVLGRYLARVTGEGPVRESRPLAPRAVHSPAIRPTGSVSTQDGLVAEAVRLLPDRAARALAVIGPWAGRSFPLQPCLCDLWHDHVLFQRDVVTGVIDYGAMRVDHPAVDLARLLGDLVGDEPDRLEAGVGFYRAAGGPVEVPAAFVWALADAGLVCAVLSWFDRLAGGPPADAAARGRFGRLVGRLRGNTGRP